MTTIIAGRFGQQSEVDNATEELARAGFARDRMASFYVNPPGQHDMYKLGGDHAISAGAKESERDVALGVATGAAIGLAATSFLGPLGAVTGGLLGAHVGGLIGGLSGMKEKGDVGPHAEDPENALPLRHAGLMLAVAVGDQQQADRVTDILLTLGGTDIETADGNIVESNWTDFDPVAPPVLLQKPRRLPGADPYRHA